MYSIQQLNNDRQARLRGRAIAQLHSGGISSGEGQKLKIDVSQCVSISVGPLQPQLGNLVGSLRNEEIIAVLDDSSDVFLTDAPALTGVLDRKSFSKPESIGPIDGEAKSALVVFCILPACTPSESLRSQPRRPGAPSTARRLAGR